MVTPRQFLERPAVIGGDAPWLEGLWHRGEARPALLVIPPLPGEGSGMDWPLCAELTFAASRRGHATLRFNFRGVGGSQGAVGGLPECLADGRAALRALAENAGHDQVALAGCRAGARVALELARQEKGVVRVALVAPDSSPETRDAAARAACPVLVIAPEGDPRFEQEGWGALRQAGRVALERVKGADPAFVRGLVHAAGRVAAFLAGAPPD